MIQQLSRQKIVLFAVFVAILILACASLGPGGDNSSDSAATQAGSTDLPPQATPTLDMEARIKAANVLVFENTWGLDLALTQVVQSALDGMGMKNYTYTKSDNGVFMDALLTDTKYDLIIVDQENKKLTITGDFWDRIYERLTNDDAALIIEIWYLDQEAKGPISKILEGCGIRYQKDLPVDSSIYWWDSAHPIFNEPNVIPPLLHYGTYWKKQAGDRIRLAEGSDATLLAGLAQASSDEEAVLATCYGGRVIIQTFSDHDYSFVPHDVEVIGLWQNYIHYTLKNHFELTP